MRFITSLAVMGPKILSTTFDFGGKYHKYRNTIEKYQDHIMIKHNKLNLLP